MGKESDSATMASPKDRLWSGSRDLGGGKCCPCEFAQTSPSSFEPDLLHCVLAFREALLSRAAPVERLAFPGTIGLTTELSRPSSRISLRARTRSAHLPGAAHGGVSVKHLAKHFGPDARHVALRSHAGPRFGPPRPKN